MHLPQSQLNSLTTTTTMSTFHGTVTCACLTTIMRSMLGVLRCHSTGRVWCVQMSFNRSSVVRVEAFVSINCSITSATTYIWQIFNATTHKPVSLTDLNLTQHVFHDPVLFIPPRCLPYGRYVIKLQVCTTLDWLEVFVLREITARLNQTKDCYFSRELCSV